jgi:biopolymer transport protein ExbD
VDKAGKVYLGGETRIEAVDNERLHRELRLVAQASPNRRVRIDADRNARFEDVVRVVDLCTFEGLRSVSLHTRGENAR